MWIRCRGSFFFPAWSGVLGFLGVGWCCSFGEQIGQTFSTCSRISYRGRMYVYVACRWCCRSPRRSQARWRRGPLSPSCPSSSDPWMQQSQLQSQYTMRTSIAAFHSVGDHNLFETQRCCQRIGTLRFPFSASRPRRPTIIAKKKQKS